MGRALLLNNWQRETRGSEEESIEARKVVSPEWSVQYVGVPALICQGSHFYLLVSLAKKTQKLLILRVSHLPEVALLQPFFFNLY